MQTVQAGNHESCRRMVLPSSWSVSSIACNPITRIPACPDTPVFLPAPLPPQANLLKAMANKCTEMEDMRGLAELMKVRARARGEKRRMAETNEWVPSLGLF